MKTTLAMVGTLLRVGLMDMVAYRTEFLIWALSANMPLVMLAVWNAVAADGAVGRFGQPEFVGYYLITMMVRLLASNWVMWEVVMGIRQGTLALRLMRPVHPLLHYATEQLAAVPMRILFISPLWAVLWVVAPAQVSVTPSRLALFAVALTGAWMMQFLMMVTLGLLSFWLESSVGLFEVYLGVSAVLSGYLVPLELFPAWLQQVSTVLPFKYMLSFPVECLLQRAPSMEFLTQLGLQWFYVVLCAAACAWVWRSGLRRFSALGG